MQILAIMIMMVCLLGSASFAATVNLNNGSSVQGNIIKKDSKSVQISVDGVTMTYYADEIKDIDGQSLTAASSAPTENAAPEANTAPAQTAATQAGDQTNAAVPAATEPAQPADQTNAAVAAATPPAANETADQTNAAIPPDNTDQTNAALPESPAVDTGSASGAINPDKKALILKFIDVFGTRQALINNFETMIQQIEKDKPDEAQKIRDRVKVDEIIDRLLPIYDRNFSADDLKSFIAFYSSPEGQKLIGTIPELMKESVQESVKYMQEKFPEVKQDQAAPAANNA